MGLAVPSPAGAAAPEPQLLLGVTTAESTFGGDCRTGFSVLLSAAGTYGAGLRGSMVGMRRFRASWVVRGDVGDTFVGVLVPDAMGV